MTKGIYTQKLEYVPHHKMGIKILDSYQMENVFPRYKTMLNKIEQHRRMLKGLQFDFDEWDSQMNLMYDNIFCIMGKRGTGKTSAVFTLKCMLQDRKKNDIVLPIIMPEVIPRKCSLIGWILSLLEDTVEKLDTILKQRCENKTDNFFGCKYTAQNSLKCKYKEVKELCYSQFYDASQGESMSTAVVNVERITQNSFKFSKAITSFWSSLVKAICEAGDADEEEPPLIYIIFDDVDLMPERIIDLLSTIIKYLSHPNVIVCVTADEELFYEVIENDLSNRLDIYQTLQAYGLTASRISPFSVNHQYEDNVLKKIEHKINNIGEIAKLYGDKILPPSSRYYLETYDTCIKKSRFVESIIKKDGEEKRVILSDFVDLKMEEYLQSLPEAESIGEEYRFWKYKGQFINAYFNFWGNTSRQLGNECLILSQLVDNLIDLHKKCKQDIIISQEDYLEELYYIFFSFIYSTLNAFGNPQFQITELQAFSKEILIYQPAEWGIYIDYDYIQQRVLEKSDNNVENNLKEQMTLCMLLFSLGFFLENILLIEQRKYQGFFARKRKHLNRQAKLVYIFDCITAGDNSLICKNQESIRDFLWIYEGLFEKPEILKEFKITSRKCVQDYLRTIRTTQRKTRLLEYIEENPKWFQTITMILFLYQEGIYDINSGFFMVYQLGRKHYIYDRFFRDKIEEAKNEFTNCIFNRMLAVKKKEKICTYEDLKEAFLHEENADKRILQRPYIKNAISISIIEEEINGGYVRSDFDILHWVIYNDKHRDIYTGLKSIIYGPSINLKNIERIKEICERISRELIVLYKEILYYEILDTNMFNDILENFNINYSVNSQEGIDIKGRKINIISVNSYDVVLNAILESHITMDAEDVFDDGLVRNKFSKLTTLVRLAILNQNDLDSAIDIVMLHKILIMLETVYIDTFLNVRVNDHDFISMTETMPYQNLYNEIKLKLQSEKEDDKYLKEMLGDCIKKGVENIYKDLVEETK